MAQTDREGTSLTEYQAVLDSFSDELTTRLATRTEESTYNWLMHYGIAQTPADVEYLVGTLLKAGIMWSVVKGFAELTESGRAAEDELAKRRAKPPATTVHIPEPRLGGTYL